MALNNSNLHVADRDADGPATKSRADPSAHPNKSPGKARVRKGAHQSRPAKTNPPALIPAGKPKATKSDAVLKLLRGSKGTTIVAMMEATGWQAHSVRGFLSGTVKKKLGFTVESETGKDGGRRYRIVEQTQAG